MKYRITIGHYDGERYDEFDVVLYHYPTKRWKEPQVTITKIHEE